MSSYTRIAAVSGANKGIGLAIVRQLSLQYPKSSFNNGPLLIYLTSRDKGRGQAALKDIQNDQQLKAAKALKADGGLTEIRWTGLDISDDASIDAFATQMEKDHGKIDFYIGNAGIAMQGFDANVAETTIASNYFGAVRVTERVLPLIRSGGRIVNVASMAGHLSSKYSEDVRSRFLSSKNVSDVDQLMNEFVSAVKEGSHSQKGWPSAAYAVSKAGLIGAARAIAAQEKAKGSQTLINVCCPGYVQTDMTKGGGSKTPDQGAQTPVLLALGDIGNQTGLFWQHEKVIQW